MLTLLFVLPVAMAEPAGWNLVPFGVGVYVHHRPVRGVVYTVTQAAGIATAAYATVTGYRAAEVEDDDTFAHAQLLSLAGVTVAAGSYLASVLDGSRLHELEQQAGTARANVTAWDDARALATRER
jgi:hypothetical protein